jgi:precorrin-6Y C5,15-methyltransferase (decarboxylating)
MITVVGTGTGAPPQECLAGAELVVGGRRHLDAVRLPEAAERVVLGPLAPALDTMAEYLEKERRVVVLASGDPGFFGIVRALRRAVAPQRLAVHPAPSSLAVAFARLGLPWDDARLVSAHARDPRPALATALRHPKVGVLTDRTAGPAWFAQRMAGSERELVVFERLGEPGERMVRGRPEELAAMAFAEPNVLVSVAAGECADLPEPAWALPEEAFDHRAGMITKREVRAVALAQLGPRTGELVWDVGCGSGSVAVECARLGAAAIAIDDDVDAVARTRANAERFAVPVRVMPGRAPAALAGLPDPDAAFVGGGGADLDAILDVCAKRVARCVVVTLAVVERAGPVLERLAGAGLATEGTLIQASRLAPLAGGHRLAAINPVVVVVGRRA